MFGYENYSSDKNMKAKYSILREIFGCFNRKMTASSSPFPCFEITGTDVSLTTQSDEGTFVLKNPGK